MKAQRTLIIIAGFALALLGAVTWAEWQDATSAPVLSDQVAHTRDVQTNLSELRLRVQDIDAGSRGFVLTGEPAFLEPFLASLNTADSQLRVVRTLTNDNPNQQARCDVLEPLIARMVAVAQTTVDLRRGSGFEAARQMVAGGKGKAVMDQIHAEIALMNAEEQTLLGRRRAAARDQRRSARALVAIGSSLSFLLLVAAFAFVLRENRLRHQAEQRLHEFNDQLEQRVREQAAELVQTSRTLWEADNRFRIMVEGVTDYAIVMLDPGGRVISWNSGATRLKGYREKEIVGQHFSRFYPEEDVARDKPAMELEQAAASGRSQDEGWRVRKDGTRFWAFVIIAALRDEGGRLRGFVKVTRDMTEHKQAQEESQVILRTAMDGFFVVDLQGRFLEANDAYCRLIGYTRDELLAIRVTDIEAAESPEATTAHIAAVMRTGSDRFVTRHRTKDGAVLDVEVSANYLSLNGGRAFVFVRDITARVQTEAELRRLRLAVDASHEVIFMTDLEGVITSVNPAFTRLYGYSAAEVVGKTTPRILKSGTMPREAYESFWNSIVSKQVVTGELINKTSDGRLLTVESSVNPILNEQEESIGFLAIQHDITERLQLEAQFRQAQKMESVGQLASGIAHDFNNLVTVINGMSDLVLAQLSQDDPAYADVDEILRAGERAATLTRQLLAFSRQQILEPRVLSFNTVVAGMEGLLRRLLGEDIDLVVVPTPGLGNVKVDPGQIEQVITNLAVNARDAMPQGGRLTIEAENVTVDENYARQHGVAVPLGSYVLLAVSDSGVGMDEATRARIFEPFFTTKGPDKGTGLGLSTVYGIVKQSHGFIWVYSEVGQGTSFKIYLPQVTEAAGTDQPRPRAVSGSGTETILLVEDSSGLRKLATRLLKPAGYTVLAVATGEEALRLLEDHEAPVHLLLSDVVLPGMSGRHLAERLAQTRPGMKVLYMSGYTSDTIVRHGVLDARVPFLNKPFTAAVLLRKVREVLDS